MAAQIRDEYPEADIELVKGGGGDFIVTLDGTRALWNKNASGQGFPEAEAILSQLR